MMKVKEDEMHEILAKSFHAFLTAQSGGAARRFFRLDGLDDAVYAALLERFHGEGDTLAGQPLWVRTTAPLPDQKTYALGGEAAIKETFRAIQDVGRWWP